MRQNSFVKPSVLKYAMCVSTLSLLLVAAGCGGIIKFEKTAEELLAQMEKDGPVVPVASSMAPSQLSTYGSLTSFTTAAAQTSPSVASAQRQMMAAQARVTEAEREFYPQIALTADQVSTHQVIQESSNPSLEGDDTQYNTTNVALTANMRLLDLPMSAAIVAARSEAEAREADFEAAKQDLRQNVLTVYAEAAEAIERWRLAQAEVQYFNARAEFERTQSNAGELRASERSVSAAELARARSDASIAAADYRIRADRLCGMAYDTACPYPAAARNGASLPRPTAISQEELGRIENSPEVRAMASRVNVALREVDQARMAMYPRLSLAIAAAQRDRGGSLFDGSSLTQTEDVTLQFEWDFYTSGRLRAIRDAQLNEALAVGHEYEAQLQAAVNDMRSATSALNALWQHDRSLNEVISLRRSAVNEISQEIKAGVASDLELAEANLELVRAEVLQQRTRRNYIVATIARARATGSIVDELVASVERVLSDNRYSARVYGTVAR
jgi:outer membrane protein TolC